MKKVLAIVPARGGSKGVKRKNLRDLGGKPLINWTLDAAKESKFIDKVVVSTEDEEIRNVALENNVEVINRPKELALDSSPTIEAILHVLDNLKDRKYIPDYVMLLQCTTPFRNSQDIDNAIKKFIESINVADSLISVTENENIPYWLKKIDNNGLLSDFIKYDKNKFVRRQDFEKLYKLNGAIYMTKIECLYKNRSFESAKSIAYKMNDKSSIDIDTETDLKYAQFILDTEK